MVSCISIDDTLPAPARDERRLTIYSRFRLQNAVDAISVDYHSRRGQTNMHVEFRAPAMMVAGLASRGVRAVGKQVPKPSPGLMPNPAASKTLL